MWLFIAVNSVTVVSYNNIIVKRVNVVINTCN